MIFTSYSPVDLDQLRGLPPTKPPRKARSHWAPINHHRLITLLLEEASNQSWSPDKLRCYLSPDYGTVTATFDLWKPERDIALSIGVANSNNKEVGCFLYGGFTLYKDRIGLVIWRHLLAEHTIRLNLENAVSKGFQKFCEEKFDNRIDKLKKIRFQQGRNGTDPVNSILIAAARPAKKRHNQKIAWSRVGQAEARYRKQKPTAFNLITSLAYSVQLSPPTNQLAQGYYLYQLVENQINANKN